MRYMYMISAHLFLTFTSHALLRDIGKMLRKNIEESEYLK